MKKEEVLLSQRAIDLRRSFDRAFAEAPRHETVLTIELLAIRVSGDPYALRLAEVSGLFADRVITPLPSPVSELLGLAGFRGALVPVYDLGALLGYPGVDDAPRWLVTVPGSTPAALAFERFEAQVGLAIADIASDPGRRHQHVRELARCPDGMRPVVHLRSVFEAIEVRARQGAQPKER